MPAGTHNLPLWEPMRTVDYVYMSPLVFSAVIICVLTDILYLLTVEANKLQSPRVWFVATYIGGLVLMGVFGQITSSALRVGFLSAGAAGMLLLGALVGLVPGSPLLLAGGLVTVALVRFARTHHMLRVSLPIALIGATTAWLVLAWGLGAFQW
jgi:hypothetical protein